MDPVPISSTLYAPYGSLIREGEMASARSANHGTALAWDALATLVNLRGASARATVSLFRCLPHGSDRLAIRVLERHPASTQMFVPMRSARYALIVAEGEHEPDLDTLAAFIVEGAQAITYAPGIWHHPMIALDREADFVNVLFTDGTSSDCEEYRYDEPLAEILFPAFRG